MDNKNLQTIDEYIALWPSKEQKILQQIRTCIKRIAPDAKEVISYQMPTFKQDGILMHFGMFQNHYSLFPGSEPLEYFASELKEFETSKGTIKIPKVMAVPEKLIETIVLHNIEKIKAKKLKKKQA
ncbi:MAG: DUF1801 domain-containing protein [Bacteroidia bacterium]|nr:DUF1801 domain-containing protein [Bacteroidia bacterium]